MNLARFKNFDPQNWDPLRQLSSLRTEIDRLFDEPMSVLTSPRDFWMGGGWPSVDVSEDRDNVTVKVEVPGMRKEDIDVSWHDGVLSISGERKAQEKFADGETHRNERFVGRFHRALTLPIRVSPEKTSATYQDGILTITLPKAEEAKPKQIQVHAD